MTEKRPSGHLGDAWIEIDKTDDPKFFVGFLDATRAGMLAYTRQYPDAAFAYLALKPGLSVLDCGCGTGEILTLIAEQIAPGEAYGSDGRQQSPFRNFGCVGALDPGRKF